MYRVVLKNVILKLPTLSLIMNRKQFLFYLWEENLVPLLLIIAGIFASYALAFMFSGFVLIDFLADFALKAILVLFVVHFFMWILKKSISKFPSNFPANTIKISSAFNRITLWIIPIGLGAMFYHAWITGNKWVIIGYSVTLIFLKIRNTIKARRNTTNAQTNL